MKGILIYDKESAEYNKNGIAIYLKEAKKHGMTLTLVYYEELYYGIMDNLFYIEYEGKLVTDLDFAINRSRDYRLAKHLESMGVRVFNNSFVNRIGNHKWETYEYLLGYQIPIPDTIFVANQNIRYYLSYCKNKVVVKAVHGHGGSQVCCYHPDRPEEMESIIKTMANEDVVIQPFIKGNGQDLRVYVIGEDIIGAVLRTATKDFRSNYSLGGSVELYQLNENEISKVRQITNCLSLDYAGIDFIIQEDGTLLFNEIEDVVGARMLYVCSNIDAIGLYMEYVFKTLNNSSQ